eukprot:1188968-Prorocentrum_minimum.AAC.2
MWQVATLASLQRGRRENEAPISQPAHKHPGQGSPRRGRFRRRTADRRATPESFGRAVQAVYQGVRIATVDGFRAPSGLSSGRGGRGEGEVSVKRRCQARLKTRLKVKNTRSIFTVCCTSDDQRRRLRAPTLNY